MLTCVCMCLFFVCVFAGVCVRVCVVLVMCVCACVYRLFARMFLFADVAGFESAHMFFLHRTHFPYTHVHCNSTLRYEFESD